MRILALKTKGLVLPSIHDSMVRAFRSLGAEVFELPVPRREGEFRSFETRARRCFEAVFTLNMGRESSFISRLKELQSSLRIPWILWFVDNPEGYRFPGACQPEWTVAFCWDRGLVQEMSPGCSRAGVPIFHLPLATDPEVFFPEKTLSDSLSFPGGVFVGSTAPPNRLLQKAGTSPGFMAEFDSIRDLLEGDRRQTPQSLAWAYLHEKTGRNQETLHADPLCRLWVHTAMYFLGIRKRRELVSLLIGPDGAVFGDPGWKKWAGGLYRGRVSYGKDLRRIYARSSFVLDIRQLQARTGLTQRVFDAGACGRPVLAEYSPELENIFDPGDGVFIFRRGDEAVETKARLLRYPEDTAMRAEKSRKRIFAGHTYRHRAGEMLSCLSRI